MERHQWGWREREGSNPPWFFPHMPCNVLRAWSSKCQCVTQGAVTQGACTPGIHIQECRMSQLPARGFFLLPSHFLFVCLFAWCFYKASFIFSYPEVSNILMSWLLLRKLSLQFFYPTSIFCKTTILYHFRFAELLLNHSAVLKNQKTASAKQTLNCRFKASSN